MIEGAILDMDGTLLDSMPMWWDLGVKLLKECDLYTPENVEMLRRMTLEEACAFAGRENRLGKSAGMIESEINAYVRDMYENVLELKPGAFELLMWLKENDVRMCVATSTDKSFAEAAFRRLGILELFEGIFSSCDLGYGKTDPMLYNIALERLGTAKEKTLVFEDVVFAARLAKENGYPVCAVMDKNEADQDTLRKISDVYIGDKTDSVSYKNNILAL